jgi:hypothetical protein
MQHEILDLIDKYWKFDEQQQPISSWHDKQDLLKTVQEELGLPDVIKSVCRCGTEIEDSNYWLCEKCREELKTK